MKKGESAEIFVRISSNIQACQPIKELLEFLEIHKIKVESEFNSQFRVEVWANKFKGGTVPETCIFYINHALFKKYPSVVMKEIRKFPYNSMKFGTRTMVLQEIVSFLSMVDRSDTRGQTLDELERECS